MERAEAESHVRATLARMALLETVITPRFVRKDAAAPRAPVALAPLGLAPDGAAGAEFVARAELGRGGMGVVQLAWQQSLAREVALKRSHEAEGVGAQSMVREARVMGVLEHPNVVPVHALGLDARGAPTFVMKKVAIVRALRLRAERSRV